MNGPECPGDCGFPLDDAGKFWRCTSWNCSVDRIRKTSYVKKITAKRARQAKANREQSRAMHNMGKGFRALDLIEKIDKQLKKKKTLDAKLIEEIDLFVNNYDKWNAIERKKAGCSTMLTEDGEEVRI